MFERLTDPAFVIALATLVTALAALVTGLGTLFRSCQTRREVRDLRRNLGK